MKDDNLPDKPTAIQSAFSMTPVAVGLEVGCLTIVIVVVAIAGGLLLDRLLGTKPLFTILLVLGSAPLSLFLTFKLAMRQIRKAFPPGSVSAGKTQTRNEENDNE